MNPALDAVRNSDITFTPARWEKLYFEWMENIRDWCSRQIVWGHQFQFGIKVMKFIVVFQHLKVMVGRRI